MRRAFVLCLGLALLGSQASAATYYVAKTGNNSNSCAAAQSLSTPKLTIGNALNCLAPGDTLYIRSGTYVENLSELPSGTDWSQAITIQTFPGEANAVIQATPGGTALHLLGERYLIFDSLIFDGNNKTGGVLCLDGFPPYTGSGPNTHHIRFLNSEFRYSSSYMCVGHVHDIEFIGGSVHDNADPGPGPDGSILARVGFYILDAGNVLIDGMQLYNLSGYGIQMYGGGVYEASGITVRNNVIHHTGTGQGACAMVVADVSDVLIYNNVMYRNGMSNGSAGCAIAIGHAGLANNVQVYNNTATGNYNCDGCGTIYVQSGSGHIIRNNILWNNVGANYAAIGGIATTDHNLIGVNPLFVNEAGHDYHLQAASPARDVGTDLSAVFTTDFAGLTRPQGAFWDLGAHEYPVEPPIPPEIPGVPHISVAWNDAAPGTNPVAGYKIYYGTVSGVYPNSVDVGRTRSGSVTGLTPGVTYYFVVVAYNADGESVKSAEVSKVAVDNSITPVAFSAASYPR